MIRHTNRTIEVFEDASDKHAVRVEVEGETVSMQVVDRRNPDNKAKLALPKPAVALLAFVAMRALALEGGPVVEQGLAVRDDIGAVGAVPVEN